MGSDRNVDDEAVSPSDLDDSACGGDSGRARHAYRCVRSTSELAVPSPSSPAW